MSTLKGKISITQVEALQPGETIWDGQLKGFGARRQKGPAQSYILVYRNKAGVQRLQTIGRHGSPWTPDEARKEAKRLLRIVEDGGDPMGDVQEDRSAETVSEMCDRFVTDLKSGAYLTKTGQPKRPSTIQANISQFNSLVKPSFLGAMKVSAVTAKDIRAFQNWVRDGAKLDVERGAKSRVRGGRLAATVALNLLSSVFRHFELPNPVTGIRRDKNKGKERRLSNQEYAALGRILSEAPAAFEPVVAAFRFLLLTGWRQSEAIELRWSHLDETGRRAVIPSKTGTSTRVLSRYAAAIIGAQPRRSEYVFSRPDGQPLPRLARGDTALWRVIVGDKLPRDVTPHIFRHSFASLGDDLEVSHLSVARLLGHRKANITEGYQHKEEIRLRAAADRIAKETLDRMNGETTEAMRLEAAEEATGVVIDAADLFRRSA